METVERAYKLAEERNISINRLAAMSGVAQNTFKAAKHRGGQLSIDVIERICEALDMPMYKFFMESTNV